MSFLPPFNISDPPNRNPDDFSQPRFGIAPDPPHANGTPSHNVFAHQQHTAPSHPFPRAAPSATQHNHTFTTSIAPLYTQFAADPASARPVPQLQPFSASTQEILKSIGTSQNVSTGTPEWEAARERVLKSMARSGEGAALSPARSDRGAVAKRGRARGRPPNGVRAGANDVVAANGAGMDAGADPGNVAGAASTPVRRARGGRPRGSKAGRGGTGRGRGGKRKRGGSEDGDELSSLSPTPSPNGTPHAPSPTITKSGRSITKPAPYTPLAPTTNTASPTAHGSSHRGRGRGRGGYRRTGTRDPAQALCAKCSRGHSPANNVIVFCDGCNTPWHQWCHDPMIGKEVVEVAEKEWLCGLCEGRKEDERCPIETRVDGESLGLDDDEKQAYLATLPSTTLRRLLLRAVMLYPTLPIFAPNTRALLHNPTQQDIGAIPAPDDPNDPYPDITLAARTNDPPSTYPRPGHGPISHRPITEPEDVDWLLEAEAPAETNAIVGPGREGVAEDVARDRIRDVKGFDGFSHYYDDGKTVNPVLTPVTGDVIVKGGGTANQAKQKGAEKGGWIQRGEGASGSGQVV